MSLYVAYHILHDACSQTNQMTLFSIKPIKNNLQYSVKSSLVIYGMMRAPSVQISILQEHCWYILVQCISIVKLEQGFVTLGGSGQELQQPGEA